MHSPSPCYITKPFATIIEAENGQEGRRRLDSIFLRRHLAALVYCSESSSHRDTKIFSRHGFYTGGQWPKAVDTCTECPATRNGFGFLYARYVSAKYPGYPGYAGQSTHSARLPRRRAYIWPVRRTSLRERRGHGLCSETYTETIYRTRYTH